jgi:hypothetical protein
MLLAKVVLGKVHNVGAFAQVRGCPAGYDSVSGAVTVIVASADLHGISRWFLTEITVNSASFPLLLIQHLVYGSYSYINILV